MPLLNDCTKPSSTFFMILPIDFKFHVMQSLQNNSEIQILCSSKVKILFTPVKYNNIFKFKKRKNEKRLGDVKPLKS